ncbi:MAG: ATPase [Lachnospiraceae bacterium]|nr:ATPase [Lachnospiraceae bacterium]
MRAICVYLSFAYPEKYYLYKTSMYKGFKKLVNYQEKSYSNDSTVNNYLNYADMCQDMIEEIKMDSELLQMQQKLVEQDDACYKDSGLHLLAQTIIYVCSEYNDEEEWFPSLSEYDPEITSEQWVEILNNPQITSSNNLEMLAMFYDYGEPATCAQLAKKYGKSANYFNKGSSSYAERVARETGCKTMPEEISDDAKWWPILYFGKSISDGDAGGYAWKIRDELKNALEQIELPKIKGVSDMINSSEIGLNTILYGPPGTGKTYNTAVYAVAIIEEKSLDEVKKSSYTDVLKRYNNYKQQGLIELITFHQSYGYEEFIEGIRPVMDSDVQEEGKLEYQIVSGIFKAFCERAARPILKNDFDIGINENPTVWKVSLEGTGDNKTRTECLENNHIRIGFDEYGDITSETQLDNGKNVLNAFISRMKIGDIVFSCYSATTIDAIGVVTGEYEYHPEYEEYTRLRNVKWLVKGINENIVAINEGKTLTLPSTYALNSITLSDVMTLLDKVAPELIKQEEKKKNHVFIIDEINRGNISKIFGELITLLEDSKRAGNKEEMETILPYSGDRFSVPNNVFVLGTMNTADRSIALIDTALRRRFEFEEMMPNSSVLDAKGIGLISQDGKVLKVSKMLDTINKRIEYLYDREHTIGHAVFMSLQSDPSIECLSKIFKKRIIPLLQEYFYEDYSKIQLVLGDNEKSNDNVKFIIKDGTKPDDIFNGTVDVDLPDEVYSINWEAFENIDSYKEIGEDL